MRQAGSGPDDAASSFDAFERLFRDAPVGLCAVDRAHRCVHVNARFARIAGRHADDLRGRSLDEAFPAIAPLLKEAARPVLERRKPALEIDTPGLRVGLAPWLDRNGDVVGFVAAVSEQDELRYRALFDAHPHPMWVYDLDTLHFLAVNEAAVHLYGWSREEFASMTLRDIRPDEDLERLARSVETASFGAPDRGAQVWRHRRKDGSLLEVEIHATSLPWADRKARLVLPRDVTAHRRAEERLRKLVRAVEASPASIVITDTDGRIEYVNPKFTEITGYGRDEVLGENPRLLKSGIVEPQTYESLWSTIGAGREWKGELVNRRKDGEFFWESVRISPVRDEDGAVTHFVAIKEDITEKKRAEAALREAHERLAQAGKMEAVGRLAGGIAHDFNNLLSVILGYGELLRARAGPDAKAKEALEQIVRAADRAAALTRQLLAFSRRQVLEPVVLDLGRTLREIEPMLRRLVGEDIELRVTAAEDLDRVKADPVQVEQIFMNLAGNARDAMSTGGVLSFELRNAVSSEGPRVRIVVSDTGDGMDTDTLSRIFEPFFTTKEVGKGTGLGLATVYGIVQQSGGMIDVRSEPGKGTTFIVDLPRCEGQGAIPRGPEPIPAAVAARGAVLVVEDDPAARQLVIAVLQGEGHRVLGAASADEALAVLDREDGSVDVLLTDVIMPGASGKDLAAVAAVRWPRLRVVFMSGYPDDKLSAGGTLAPGVTLLRKPFTIRALARSVSEALGVSSPEADASEGGSEPTG